MTLTDRRNDRWRNKYTRFAWAGGTFFPVVLYVVSVFGSGGKKVLVQIRMYHLEYNTVVLLCQFLNVAGNSSQNENIFLQ
jgi:hypothetical protein